MRYENTILAFSSLPFIFLQHTDPEASPDKRPMRPIKLVSSALLLVPQMTKPLPYRQRAAEA